MAQKGGDSGAKGGGNWRGPSQKAAENKDFLGVNFLKYFKYFKKTQPPRRGRAVCYNSTRITGRITGEKEPKRRPMRKYLQTLT